MAASAPACVHLKRGTWALSWHLQLAAANGWVPAEPQEQDALAQSPPEARHLGLVNECVHGWVGHAARAVQDAQAPERRGAWATAVQWATDQGGGGFCWRLLQAQPSPADTARRAEQSSGRKTEQTLQSKGCRPEQSSL